MSLARGDPAAARAGAERAQALVAEQRWTAFLPFVQAVSAELELREDRLDGAGELPPQVPMDRRGHRRHDLRRGDDPSAVPGHGGRRRVGGARPARADAAVRGPRPHLPVAAGQARRVGR
jgi:hypothetical protein